MSCNGCRVLRKGCSESCILRPCLEWIENAEAQANATLFVAKFFGRADLMSFISAVPIHQRPALFQSLLFEACGRTVNPVNGAVGLLSSGNWHICQAAVNTVLRGGILRPIPHELLARAVTPITRAVTTDSIPNMYGMSYKSVGSSNMLLHPSYEEVQRGRARETTPFGSETSATTATSFENIGENDGNALGVGVRQKTKLLNLFV